MAKYKVIYKPHITWASHNPAGIVINPGWYALLACLLSNMSVEEAIVKIMCGDEQNIDYRPRKKTSKKAAIREAYKKGMSYKELAERFCCSVTYVWDAIVRSGRIERPKDYYLRIQALMEENPRITQKEVSKITGCGLSTASRHMRRVYKERGIGYFKEAI